MGRRIIERHVSPDGALTFIVLDCDGDIALGFQHPSTPDDAPRLSGHTHPDILARCSSVPEPDAVRAYISDLVESRSLIAVARVAHEIREIWLTENPCAEYAEYKDKPPEEVIEFRYWDGRQWEPS